MNACKFQVSVPTIASKFQEAINDQNSNINSLVDQFGHLRPGTYDVRQLAYWENPDFFFSRNKKDDFVKLKTIVVFTEDELGSFKNLLDNLPIM